MPKKEDNEERNKQNKDAESATVEKESDSNSKGRTLRQKLKPWFLIHVLLAFFVLFVTFFLIMVLIEALYSTDVEAYLQANLLLSCLFAVAYTFSWNLLFILEKGMNLLTDKALGSMRKEFLERNQLKPIEERLALRKPYFALCYCLTLLWMIFLAFLILSLYRYPAFPLGLKPLVYILPAVFLIIVDVATFIRYNTLVTNEEYASFLHWKIPRET